MCRGERLGWLLSRGDHLRSDLGEDAASERYERRIVIDNQNGEGHGAIMAAVAVRGGRENPTRKPLVGLAIGGPVAPRSRGLWQGGMGSSRRDNENAGDGT